MLFDHDHRLIYACLSPRTHIELLDKISVLLDYRVVAFNSVDTEGESIYHTNVMMAMLQDAMIVCMDSIPSKEERQRLELEIRHTNRTIIDISMDQVNAFAGNMIQLVTGFGEPVLVMSQQAHQSLTPNQLKTLSSSSKIIAPDLKTIEFYGGGSARCMIAEVFLEERERVA